MNNPTRSPTTKIQCNEDGSLDEVFGTGDFHLEQMDSNHWWMALETSAGRVVVNLRARGKISAYVEADPPLPKVPEVDRREALYDAIEQVLLHHKMHNWRSDEDGEDALGLVDRLCDHEAKDISSGQHEVRLICDAIYSDDGVRAVLAACFAGGSPARDVEAPAATGSGAWIDIEVRRPELFEKVLLLGSYYGGKVAAVVGVMDSAIGDFTPTFVMDPSPHEDEYDKAEIWGVTHWMPLPAAPIGSDK